MWSHDKRPVSDRERVCKGTDSASKRVFTTYAVLATRGSPPRVTPARYRAPVANLIDSGWAAWLPFELVETLEARSGGPWGGGPRGSGDRWPAGAPRPPAVSFAGASSGGQATPTGSAGTASGW